jgi:glycosyltransferase involved in cell wall biosynthesis
MSKVQTVPLVSALMPTFNAGSYVEEAIQSILDQTVTDFELIVQDDGSTDTTLAVVEKLAARDRRIVVAETFGMNRGVIAARNALLAKARGRFIAWMDADDAAKPDRFARQLAYLEAHPGIGALGTAIEYADENLVAYRTERYSTDPVRQAIDPEICCATVMARREIVEKVGKFRDAFRPGGEDGDWILRIAERAQVTNIDDVLYTYRQHDSTSKRSAGAIRRLGVLSRYAARVRRQGRPDPIDTLTLDDNLDYLSDNLFLDHRELSAEEKVTALSLPLPRRQRLVSVLIPYFDAHRFFDQCLDHLAAQSFKNIDVLIYDDGSREPLRADHVSKHLGEIPFVLERGEENRGVAFARSRLLAMSSADFIAWQDADDYSSEDRIEVQIRHLLNHPDCNAVGSAINYLRHSIVTRSEFYFPQAFGRKGFSGCCATFMIRKAAADAIGGFDDKFKNASEDVDFLSKIEPIQSVRNIGDVLYYYRKHGSQMTGRPDWLTAQTFYYMARQLENYGLTLRNKGPTTAEECRDQIDAFMRLRKARIDGTSLGEMYVRMVLLDVKSGKSSAFELAHVLRRFPRSFGKALIGFFRHRGALALRSRNVPTVADTEVAPSRPGESGAPWRAAPPPKLVTERPAPIVVRCLDSWGDLDDAISHLTPEGKGIWGKVAFVRETSFAPDWHVVFNSVGALPVELEASPNRIIYAVGEPPTKAHQVLHRGQGQNSLVLTSDEALVARQDVGRRFVLAPAITRAWSVRKSYDELQATAIADKPRRLSWVTSNLTLLRGHRYRLAFLEKLKKEVEFDLFGRGFRPLDDKWDGLAPYRYSIAFENTRADYYFTEKLMDCFVAETMPIYYGSPLIAKFFPPESMVLIDPEDDKVFDKIRDVIGSDLWRERREAIREAKQLVLEKYNTFAYLAEFIENMRDEPLPLRRMQIAPAVVDFGRDE